MTMAVKARCTSSTTMAGMVRASTGKPRGTTAAARRRAARRSAFSLRSTSVMSPRPASSSVAAPAISTVPSPTSSPPTNCANAARVVGIFGILSVVEGCARYAVRVIKGPEFSSLRQSGQ